VGIIIHFQFVCPQYLIEPKEKERERKREKDRRKENETMGVAFRV
jgi:hypothetical protein